ncbi:MAG TPA: sigma factor-like helix-turn-helix DNA-binding protein [Candidatus Saccharimonadales bacterium]|nr:sigma factor-like helix-turn-helix DNA-binding protein [Candidatus Saccharimonadales bacterium]
MAEVTPDKPTINVEQLVTAILDTIEREREREIVARRFGLFDRRETLEQIGELLGITRERVRQLEKAIVTRLKATGEKLPNIPKTQANFVEKLESMGKAARISNFTNQLVTDASRLDQARVAFLAELCPKLVVVSENDFYHHSVGLAEAHDEKAMKEQLSRIIAAIKTIGKPTSIDKIAAEAKISNPEEAAALASISKELATLGGQWGLIKWPIVNPRNIRDKIYVILKEKGTHMHFNEIAAAIKDSDFKRKDVTTQAIHNELIKDSRFVLIGRGIYALKEWGYKKGTVSDIIAQVLSEAGEPLHRDEIVKRVLKSRFVKETTILLNLQGKPQFKRVAKATYTLADTE